MPVLPQRQMGCAWLQCGTETAPLPVKLSIVIVNYRVPYFLEQCLLSVQKSGQGMDMDIWVVDNNSGDGSVEYLRSRFPTVHFIANEENVGFSRANNQAIRISTGEYVLLLNPDTLIGESTLRTVVDFMDAHPHAGGLGVKMLNAHGQFLPESKRGFPSPWVSFCKLSGLNKLFPRSRRFNGYHLGYLSHDEVHHVEVLAGAFMLMRRKALDEVGLLDERFFMYGEDIDLSYRLVQGGYDNFYYPTPILHYKGESSSVTDVKYLRSFHGAMGLFFDKYYRGKLNPLAHGLINLIIQGRTQLALALRHFKQERKTETPPVMQSWHPSEGDASIYALHNHSHILVNTDEVTCDHLLATMEKVADRQHTFHLTNNVSGRIVSP